MKLHERILLVSAGLMLIGQAFAANAGLDAADSPAPRLPRVSGPIAVTPRSRPFLSMRAAVEAAGYVEEEFFVSGEANVYDWTGSGHQVRAIAGPGKYVTRILVRRPREPARFSGNIELTLLNASLNADLGGPADFGRMVAQGDVWIGITSKPVAAHTLKHFDPERYAALDWSNPRPRKDGARRPR